jgi:hypothetical protein
MKGDGKGGSTEVGGPEAISDIVMEGYRRRRTRDESKDIERDE